MSNVSEALNSLLTTLVSEKEHVVNNNGKRPLIVAIDGNCGSGKTFYSSKLASRFNAEVIHCDDFFLPKNMRTVERLSEVGGNVHYERLRALLAQIHEGNLPITYLAYNCTCNNYEQKTLSKTNVVIVEGSYSLHPTLREFYDLKILFTIDEQTQQQRLIKREGAERLSDFVNKWIPLENRYFDALSTTDCVVIDTGYETD